MKASSPLRTCLIGVFIVVSVACRGTVEDIVPTPLDTGEVLLESTVPSFLEAVPGSCTRPEAREEMPFDELVIEAKNPDWAWIYGQGLAVADIDLDGDLDLLYPTENATYLNNGDGDFSLDKSRLPEYEYRAWISALSVADYDGDGDFDVFVSVYEHGNRLWQNDGTGMFFDVTEAAGITQRDYNSQGSSWADFDGDGDLDLFVANHGTVEDIDVMDFAPASPNTFFVNNGDGTFIESPALLPESTRQGYTFQGIWFDFDDDGDLDLYMVNDFGSFLSNLVLRNEGDHFIVAPKQGGLDIATFSMGVALGDANFDGRPDFFVSSWGSGFLMMSQGRQWVDYSDLSMEGYAGAGERVGWGVWFSDMNVDGLLDLYLLCGYLDTFWQNPMGQDDSIYVSRFDKSMVDESALWGVSNEDSGRGLVMSDLNRDGWPDAAYSAVLGNHGVLLSRCGTEAWLRVSLEQPGMNRHAVGAKVRVGSDEKVWTEWISAGGVGFAGGGPPEALFGLGEKDQVAFVQVIWPDQEISLFTDVTTRQALHIRREP